ncbi:MAG: replication-associated recombination protein A [Parachlamydiales bacterium]
MRPKRLEEVVGQDLAFIHHVIEAKRPLSLILWGPPGCGKTTIARLYAKAFGAKMLTFSAVTSGIADLKAAVKEAKSTPLLSRYTLLFVDEIHRFNKAQQDGFLPYLEDGTLVLVGATTENPSFSLNDALLSRVRVLQLKALDEGALGALLDRYEGELPVDEAGRALLIELAAGDGRALYNLVENLRGAKGKLGREELLKLLQRRAALYDRKGEGHYNLISALHKAVRGSDPDAALYWFARMLEGGEEPLFIARRLIRMASEDIGLADPEALKLAVAAKEAYQMLGTPEGELALAQVVVYLALAPKSNRIYTAYKGVRAKARESTHLPPPAHILNAPTKLMRELGYGEGYRYDHDEAGAFSGQDYFPDGMERQRFYEPVERGFEREMIKRLEYFKKRREGIG